MSQVGSMVDRVNPSIQIRFNGKIYDFWQQVSVVESVDDLCASLRLQLGLSGTGLQRVPITENTVFEVLADNELVSTMRADVVHESVSSNSYNVAITGRSLARELVDCQYSKNLNGLTLAEIVKRLCKVFNVPIKIDAETAVVPHFSMQSEIPGNALINAVRAGNLLLMPTEDGGLLLTKPSSSPPIAKLEYGTHFKSYNIINEYKLRFSDYCIKSFDYESSIALQASVKDKGIMFFRPMHIIGDKHGKTIGACQRRAELERNRRLARANRIEVVVQGWGHQSGLWRANQQVRVVIPQERIDGEFLLGERELMISDSGGRVTRLQFMKRDAFLSGDHKNKTRKSIGVKN